MKDIARNTLQRQDIYNRQRLTEDEQNSVYKTLKFGLLPNAPIGQSLENNSKLGNLYDVIPVFKGILEKLNEKNASIWELKEKLNLEKSLQTIVDIVQLLVWAGYIHPLRKSSISIFSDSMNA